MPKRNKKGRKSASREQSLSQSSMDPSSMGPLASSSPTTSYSAEEMSEEERQAVVKQRMQNYIDALTQQFEEFLAGIPQHIRSMPFSRFMEILLNDDEPSEANLDNSEFVFKVPTAKKHKKKDNRNRMKSVHWEDSSNNQSQPSISGSQSSISGSQSSINGNQPSINGNQPSISGNQPSINGNQPSMSGSQSSIGGNQLSINGNQSSTSDAVSLLKTPRRNGKVPFAVVTPGPNINRTRTVVRLAKEGETAVSLQGSPLLFTPFTAGRNTQGTLLVQGDDGNTLAILKPPSESHDDSQLAELDEETKKKIKSFATFLMKSIESGP